MTTDISQRPVTKEQRKAVAAEKLRAALRHLAECQLPENERQMSHDVCAENRNKVEAISVNLLNKSTAFTPNDKCLRKRQNLA